MRKRPRPTRGLPRQEEKKPYTLVLVRRMEVECGGERYTAAGTLCPRELEILRVE
jgi:hypothetical protein